LVILAGLIVLAFAAPEPRKPLLGLAPQVTDFGTQDIGSASEKVVTLHNTEQTPFLVAGIMAEGLTQGDFSVDAARCVRIEPGADCRAVVSFNPRATGSQSATFRIVDAANATSQTFVARGVGTQAAPPPPPPNLTPPPPAPEPVPPPPPVNVTPPPVHVAS